MVSRSFKTREEAEEFAQHMDAPKAFREIQRKNRQQFCGEMSPEAAHFLGYASAKPAPDQRWSVAVSSQATSLCRLARPNVNVVPQIAARGIEVPVRSS